MTSKATNRLAQPYIDHAVARGCTVLGVEHSKHVKIRLQTPDGRTGMLTTGSSESDHRAAKNNMARLNRFINGTVMHAGRLR